MLIAEAQHMDGFNRRPRTHVSSAGCAKLVTVILFAMAPFIDGEELATHDAVGVVLFLIFVTQSCSF